MISKWYQFDAYFNILVLTIDFNMICIDHIFDTLLLTINVNMICIDIYLYTGPIAQGVETLCKHLGLADKEYSIGQ